MGIKRWLLALLILVVVLGFIFFIFLQSGADKQIAEVVIPKIEQKFGVTVTYDSVSVSLTSVSFKNVALSPLRGKKRSFPFAIVDRLGVNFRVGPLLLGNLDITGVRVDGLHVLMGKGANGASIAQWRGFLETLKAQNDEDHASDDGGDEKASAGLVIPDVYVANGELVYNDTRFLGGIEELSGRITPGNKAVMQAQRWMFGDGKYTALKGEHLEIEYDYSLTHIAADMDNPDFTLPADAERSEVLAANLQKSLRELGVITAKEEAIAEPKPRKEGSEALDVVVKIHGASGSMVGKESRELLSLEKVNAEFLTNSKMHVSARASGGLVGTDARWALQGAIPKDGEPTLVLEVPDLPLKELGTLLLDSKKVDWSTASADGQMKVDLLKGGNEILLEGQASLAGLKVSNERISPLPLENLRATFDYKASYDVEKKMIHIERLLVSRDMARVTFRGDVNLDHFAFDLKANVPATSCRQIFEAIPKPLRREVDGVSLEGRLGLELRVAFDIQTPDKTVLDATLDNRCKISDWGTILRPNDLRRPFAYMAYDEDGKRIRLTTGAGTNRWTPFVSMSPYLVAAALTTEDGKFEYHKGVTLPEIRSAFLMNLNKEGMFHGGSTITMQLAKNLFLSRDRTVARKLQELFFVWYLESNFTKNEILELYFNVIEFGPSLYGIGEASFHYFGRDPQELNLLESVFLIKLLPNPVARHKVWETGDTLSERKTKSLHRVLGTMLKRKRITEVEYNEALRQNIQFYKEGMALPEPRVPVNRSYDGGDAFYGEDEDSSFEETQEDNW